MAGLSFEKYEGLGNDFVIVRADRVDSIDADLARRACDRHFGIGADGVILLLPPSNGADVTMRVINADGSVPEMCGNGLRCVALAVARDRALARAEVRVWTDAGLRVCDVNQRAGAGDVRVDMGDVRFVARRELQLPDAQERAAFLEVDAGNPHAVHFGAVPRARAAIIGPYVERHALFPHGTNVEFVTRTEAGLEVLVWERGVGFTLACGTGACATVVAAIHEGLAEVGRPIGVQLPGGALEIQHDPSGTTQMRGPAHFVFCGEWVR
jgi:diaminopimelate epimerase